MRRADRLFDIIQTLRSAKQPMTAATLAEKKKLYGDYHKLRDSSKELTVAKANADKLLGIAETAQNQEAERTAQKRNTHER